MGSVFLHSRAKMQLFVKTLRGNTLTLAPAQSTSVADLKVQVEEKDGVPAEEQVLICAGRVLHDSELVSTLGDESTVDMCLALDGGKKKRKKKTYSKPKKIAHKHKKVKLAVLKYYRVDQSSGKVSRTRKECPHEDCGAGVFMGLHFNRHYCGKCGLTFKIEDGKK